MTVAVKEKKEINVKKGRSSEAASMTAARKRRMVLPEYQVFRKENAFEIRAYLPGVGVGNLDVNAEDEWLKIRGVADDPAPEGFNKVYSEFTDTDYEIGFRIPPTVNREGVKAALANGVLTITLPKQEEHARRTIEVNAV